ncbi:MAG: DNA polymerase III subunit delta [Pirellulales bacterium]|nr:DNA polymerase III subunit delta [Pirellulales bacterium]
MATSSSLSALTYLQNPKEHRPTPCCIVHGGDLFLKRETIAAIRRMLFREEEDAELSLTRFNGQETEPRDVFDALSTISLFGSAVRLVIVEMADPFVSAYRAILENYVDQPCRDAVLVLDVAAWPGNTRLAKRLASEQWLVIDCSPPDPNGKMPAATCRGVRDWLIRWASEHYGLKLATTTADAILQMVSLAPGLLDQELAKLAGLVGQDQQVTLELVRSSVGQWRTRTVWEMIDAALDGNAPEAIHQLDRLLAAGEAPQAMLPLLASSLRRLTMAGRLITDAERNGSRIPIGSALKDAGILPFKLKAAEHQLRLLGRDRADHCLDWLLDADFAMKGTHSSGDLPRLVLEQLILRLAKGFR